MSLGVTIDNVSIVVTGALVVALYLIAQGLYGLRTGVFSTLLPGTILICRAKEDLSANRVRHILPGAVILVLLIETALRDHVTLGNMEDWFAMHTGPVVVIIALAGFGLWFLVRPDTMVRWVQQANPETPLDSRIAVVIVRFVSAMMLAFAISILASIVRFR